jgi:hypothetical protein
MHLLGGGGATEELEGCSGKDEELEGVELEDDWAGGSVPQVTSTHHH